MKNLDRSIVLVFVVLTVVGQGFGLLFKGLFWDRDLTLVLASLPTFVPWCVLVTLVGAVVLSRRTRGVREVALQLTQGPQLDPGRIRSVQKSLTKLSAFFLFANLVTFLVAPLILVSLLALVGQPFPRLDDLIVVELVGLALGAMGTLQGIAMTDGLLVRFREALGAVALPEGLHDLRLEDRILWTTLASVFFAGVLAAVSALGFYRELAVYYTTHAADAVAAASTNGADAVGQNELKVIVQMGGLLAVLLAWTTFLIFVVVSNLRTQLHRLNSKVLELSSDRQT